MEVKQRDTRANIFLIFLAAVVITAAVWPFFKNSFPGTHDTNLFATWLYEFDYLFSAGQLVPRWLPDIWLGLGSPIFNYIQPLFYYIGELWHLLGFSLINAVKAAIILSVVLGFVFMYWWAKSLWGKWPALVAAAVYTLFPYRGALLYIRGDFSEYLATSLFPLILLAATQLAKKRNLGYFLLSALSLALLFLSHNLQSLLFIPFLFFYLAVLYWPEVKKSFWLVLLAVIFAACLAAFFMWPAFFERNLINVEALRSGQYDWHRNFIGFFDLLKPKWDSYDFQQIGPLGLVILVLILYLLLARKKLLALEHRRLAWFFLITVFVTAFLCLSWSQWFWQSVPLAGFIQFPYRVLTFLALGLSAVAGLLFLPATLPAFGFKKLAPKHLAAISVVIILLVSLVFIRPVRYLSAGPDSQYYPLAEVFSQDNVTATMLQDDGSQISMVNVYGFIPPVIPAGLEVATIKQKVKDSITALSYQVRETGMINYSKIQLLSGDVELVKQEIVKPNHYNFSLVASEMSRVAANIFWFPGWEARLDEQPIAAINHDDALGRMVFLLSPGQHELSLRFADTPLRRAATVVSIISGILWLLLLVVFIFRIFTKKIKYHAGQTFI